VREILLMRQWPLILIALALLHIPASAAPPTTAPATRPSVESKPAEKDGVSITVAIEQPVIPAGGQPRFVVRFKNTSADYINLYDVEAFWDWRIQFTSTDKQAVYPGPWRLRMAKLPNRYPIAHKQIKAGESLEVAVNLNDPPFTFDFVYEGAQDRLVAPVRRLIPGTYQMAITITLQNPFGPGYHLWAGPLTTQAVEFKASETGANGRESQPTTQEVAAYDDAISQVTKKIEAGGLWMNGGAPNIRLPADAKSEEVIASAVNVSLLGSKVYRILRVQQFDRSGVRMSAALVRVGAKMKILVFFFRGRDGWWSRFYDTDFDLHGSSPTP
jgi:hypothetical protein